MRSTSGARTVARHAARAASAALLLGVVALAVALVLVPRAVGGQSLTVVSGSMTPTYPVGTVVVIRPVAPDDVAPGDVITYQERSGSAELTTHRVLEVRVTDDGRTAWTTKGDANPGPDADAVPADALRGAVWYAVPYAGRALSLGGDRRNAGLLVAAALVAYAAWQVAAATTGGSSGGPPARPRPRAAGRHVAAGA